MSVLPICVFLVLHPLIAFKLVNGVSVKLPEVSDVLLMECEPETVVNGPVISVELLPSSWGSLLY